MSKRNHYSDRFEKKSSTELRKVINEIGFEKYAKLAAVWELERRNEATEEDTKLAYEIETDNYRQAITYVSRQRYRTFWPRFVAAIIDGFVMWPIGLILNYLTKSDIGTVVVIGNLLNNFSPYIYSILFHGFKGQTLGKMAMGVKVVNFEGEDQIDIKQAFIRDSVPFIIMIVLFVYSYILISNGVEFDNSTDFSTLAPMIFMAIISLLWTLLEIISMLFNEKSRAIHDLIAGTVVIRTDQ